MTAPIHSYGERWHGYRSDPKPPPEIWEAMSAAGKAGDDVALGLARARYKAWLADQGFAQPELGWPTRGEEDR